MRYIGGKSNLLEDIGKVIFNYTEGVSDVIDIFCGSGVVSSYLKLNNYNVIGNDIMYFAYVLSRGTTGLNKIPKFSSLKISNPIRYLNELRIENTDIDIKDCFIYQNYTPHDNIERMYFQKNNAIKIDIIRITIERWKESGLINEDEYYYLLASLIAAVPYVSNIAGVYGAYLKFWEKRTYKKLEIKEPATIIKGDAWFYNENCDKLLVSKDIKGDLLYADPPYNSRQYLPNYHILETIAEYDYPNIHGITGLRDYQKQRSDFCMVKKVEGAFRRLIENAKVRYVLISYNSEGLLSTEVLSKICKEYAKTGTFRLFEMSYRRYNNAKTKPGSVKEQLYFFEK